MYECRSLSTTVVLTNSHAKSTGTKIVFWDLREVLIDGLYKGSVSQSRMEKVISVLDPVRQLFTSSS